jgi:prephenate dehydratase
MTSSTGKIAFQGKTGAYSDLACRAAYPKHTPLPCATFLDAFIAVETGKADLAMIPIDNTIAGRVADIHYLLPQYHLHFVGEYFLPIDHCLLGLPDAKVSDIKTVYSHAHALPQCRKLIKEMKWDAIVGGDTAGCAERVAQGGDKSAAAIASSLCAELYGLKILRKNIADEKNNITRFLALSRKPDVPAYKKHEAYVTALIFSVKNMPAALYKVLGGFATNGVNMLKLESYMPGGAFASTLFYAEVEGHQKDAALGRAIEEIHFFGKDVRILGTFKAHRNKPIKY